MAVFKKTGKTDIILKSTINLWSNGKLEIGSSFTDLNGILLEILGGNLSIQYK